MRNTDGVAAVLIGFTTFGLVFLLGAPLWIGVVADIIVGVLVLQCILLASILGNMRGERQ